MTYGIPTDTPAPDYTTYGGNTSATGGFLAPMQPPPDDDQALDVDVQQTIAGITGLALNFVRPRWQPKSPQQPEVNVNWIAVGVTASDAHYTPAVVHVGANDGYDVLMQQEQLTVLLSFYGPAASAYAKILRDGFQIAQNREAMAMLGLSFVAVGRATTLPAVVGELWQRRVDVELTLRRQVTRTYAVQNILRANGTIVTDDGATTPWDTANVATQP